MEATTTSKEGKLKRDRTKEIMASNSLFCHISSIVCKAPKTIINSDRIRFRRLIKSKNLAKDCVIYEITVDGSTQIELEKIDERKEKDREGEQELEWK